MKRSVCKLGIFILFLLIALQVSAQIDLNQELPLDSKVKIGKLDNGLTYYIRQNDNPKERAEFWLVVDAGSVLEDDDQDGLAHFCEHMAFNGTKNFEKKEIIYYLQSIGMKFGPEINAFTSWDVTNYMLQKVPVDPVENIDTALMILFDWAHLVSNEDEEIDNERGVIREEWRSRRSADFRMRTEYQKTLLKGSKYAERTIIGDINIIDNCPYDALRRFYNEWYRADLEAVVAVGDFDPAVIEQKIIDMFSKIPAIRNPRKREHFEVPDHDETLVQIVKDKEARYVKADVYYKHDVESKNKLGDYRRSLMHSLYNMMINERLSELLEEENPPFLYAYSAYTSLVRTKNIYVSGVYLKNNEFDRGLKTVLEENERVRVYGFVESELERNKRKLIRSYEKAYNERLKKKSTALAWEYYSHFLDKEPIPGIEFEYEKVQELLPGITLEEINALAKNWITEKNRVIIVTGPDNPEISIPGEDKILRTVSSIKAETLKPYVDKISNKPLIASDQQPFPSKVDQKTKNRELDYEEWILKNGARVILKQTDFKDDEIMFYAYSKGGSSLYPVKDDVSASIADEVISNSGVGDFSKIELNKILSDKVIRLNPFVSELSEGMSGLTTPADFETFMQLMYLYFTKPRKDNKAYSSYYNRQIGWIENRNNDPATALSDTFQVTMAQYHPRRRPWTEELLGEANFNRVHYIYRDRFADGSDFTFFFVGNIDLKVVKPIIEKYIGGLPALNRKENFIDPEIKAPEKTVEKVILKEMEIPKASIVISFHGPFEYTLDNRLNIDAISDILDVRLTETIREEEGGTYSPSVYSTFSRYPKPKYNCNIYFECSVENAEKLSGIVMNEIEKLRSEGPRPKDLENVKENKLKEYSEDLRENRYWLGVLRNYAMYGEPLDEIQNYKSYVEKMDVESIQKTARTYFKDNYVKVVLTVPEK
jgi:zinc protease